MNNSYLKRTPMLDYFYNSWWTGHRSYPFYLIKQFKVDSSKNSRIRVHTDNYLPDKYEQLLKESRKAGN